MVIRTIEPRSNTIALAFKPNFLPYDDDDLADFNNKPDAIALFWKKMDAGMKGLGVTVLPEYFYGLSSITIKFPETEAGTDAFEDACWRLKRHMLSKKTRPLEMIGTIAPPKVQPFTAPVEDDLAPDKKSDEYLKKYSAEESVAYLNEHFDLLRYHDASRTLNIRLKKNAFPYHQDDVVLNQGLQEAKISHPEIVMGEMPPADILRLEGVMEGMMKAWGVKEMPEYDPSASAVEVKFKDAEEYNKAKTGLLATGLPSVREQKQFAEPEAKKDGQTNAEREMWRRLKNEFVIFPEDDGREFVVYNKALPHHAILEKTKEAAQAMCDYLKKNNITATLLAEETHGAVIIRVKGDIRDYYKAKQIFSTILNAKGPQGLAC